MQTIRRYRTHCQETPIEFLRSHLHPGSINFLINAGAFFGFGIALLIDPAGLRTMGVELTNAAAYSEIRGFYGGTQLGLAAMFAAAAFRAGWTVPILFAQVVILYGMALGRIVGLIADGYSHPGIPGFAALQIFGGTAAVLMLRGMKMQSSASIPGEELTARSKT